MELIVILLLLLLVFGPDRLPEIGAKLGQGVRSMRRATRDFSAEIQQAREAIEKPASEIAAPVQQIAQPIQEVVQPFQDVKASALALSQAAQAVRDPGKAIRDSVMQSVKGDRATGGEDGSPAAADAAPGASAEGAVVSPSEDDGPPALDGGEKPAEPPTPAASDLAG
jgi:TatA/E family protein of Tat protein translocase